MVESVHSSSFSVPRAVLGAIRGASFSPTECELEPGDEILSVDGKKVTTIKHCIKNFRNSSSLRVVWRIRRAYCTTDEIPPENSAEVEGLLTQPRTARGESGSPGTSRRSSGAGLEDADAPLDGERNRRSSLTFKTLSLGSQKLHQLQRSRNVPFCKVKLDRTTCCCL